MTLTAKVTSKLFKKVTKLSKKQQSQENQYSFPYHYLNFRIEEHRLLRDIEFLFRLKKVKELLKPFTGQKILDAGCGDGRLIYELRNEKVKSVGIDLSTKAIKFAQAFNPHAKFHVQTLERLSLRQKFDQATLLETLEHLKPKSIPLVIINLSRLLKTNGQLIISVPTTNLPMSKKHYRH